MNVKNIFWKFLLLLLYLEVLLGWGFFSHRKINYYFVFSLEKNESAGLLCNFYKHHIKYLIDHAGDPDKRRAYYAGEKQKHFLNIECFGEDIMKQDYISYDEFLNYYAYNLAKKLRPELKTSEEIGNYVKSRILSKYGTNPWSIIYTKNALTEAFKNKDINNILLETVNLAHYIADSCVVFHCTENYDGQLTNQHGIHAFWETTIPQNFFDDEFGINEKNVPTAQYDENFKRTIWQNVLHSNAESRRALEVEKKLDKDVFLGKFCYKARGNNVYRMNAKEYSREYNRRLQGQVANQTRLAIKLIADAVYTAWVDAGRPLLNVVTQEGQQSQNIINENTEIINTNEGEIIAKRGRKKHQNNNNAENRNNRKKYAGGLVAFIFIILSLIYKRNRCNGYKKRSGKKK